MIFVSAPYTHPDKNITQHRVDDQKKYIAHLLKQGKHPISVVVFGHPFVKHYRVSGTFEFWQDYCLKVLNACSEMHVLTLPGWSSSEGIKAEIAYAKSKGVLVKYVSMYDYSCSPDRPSLI